MKKVTTDVHDHHSVDVTEHYTGDRVDVLVKPDTLQLKMAPVAVTPTPEGN